MNLVFRTDASCQIGTGHVIRCLTLARELRERGAECLFVCRAHDGHLIEQIELDDFQTIILPRMDADHPNCEDNQPHMMHAHWLGSDWRIDAQQTISAIKESPVDWLVIDHYALDVQWERELRPYTKRILVIDDLADRKHDCDLLLDQNLGREGSDYSGLIQPGIETLIGPKYALLRPEFSQWRERSLARRTQPKFRNLLITLGGVDKDNLTGELLTELSTCELPDDLQITVILGLRAPWIEDVQAKAASMPHPTKVLLGVSNMANWMAESDLAIGSAGGTAWERCVLGVPTVVVVQAENQKSGAEALQANGAAILVDNVQQIGCLLKSLNDKTIRSTFLVEIGNAAANVTDGQGVQRVARVMCGIHV